MPTIKPLSNKPKPYWTHPEVVRGISVWQGDVLETLRNLPSKSVQMAVTSPPYWGLRDYQTGQWFGGDETCDHIKPQTDAPKDRTSTLVGRATNQNHEREPWKKGVCGKCGAVRVDSQLGSEKIPDCLGWARGDNCAEYDWANGCFVCRLVLVFRELRRVLRDDGTFWLNLGDSFSSNAGGRNRNGLGSSEFSSKYKEETNSLINSHAIDGIPSGNMCGVPWRTALALQADGWVLRSDVPWVKRSPMPESVMSRPTKALEYVFMFAKADADYYFDMDAVKQKSKGTWNSHEAFVAGGPKKKAPTDPKLKELMRTQFSHETHHPDTDNDTRSFRNADLWFQSVDEPHGLTFLDDEMIGLDVTSEGYNSSHYAVFPRNLVRPLIMASTSAFGCCAECKKPYERVVSKEVATRDRPNEYVKRVPGEVSVMNGEHHPPGQTPNAGSRGVNTCANTVAGVKNTTLGWRKMCTCKTDEVVPCTVLEPFLGSGTTLSVCVELGRYGVGIELSDEYIRTNAIPRIMASQLALGTAELPRFRAAKPVAPGGTEPTNELPREQVVRKWGK